jgi:hypothetical protein
VGERHQWLNVTFGIWVDTDGDESRETLLTDFDTLKGYMPQRVQGDLDIIIRTRNLGRHVGEMENFIESRIFRGLGFSITPRNGTWENSYTAERSTLISETVEGGYQHLIFRQSDTQPYETDTIVIHAVIDATARQYERLLKLHDGATFVYRQTFAGPGQYELHDTHVQGVLGARSDPRITARVNPVTLSTVRDTFFLDYALSDANEPHSADDRGLFQDGVFFQSWGFGDTAATTYMGGRDGRELLFSVLDLGDRTRLRVEVNNNTDADWRNVRLTPQPPAGVTVTPLFTDSATLPPPLWPDMPFLHVTEIPSITYGVYYFEIQTDPAAVDLQDSIVEIPIQFQADGAPADFAIPTAKLAIRSAAGSVPEYISGFSSDLTITDTLNAAVTPTLALLLTPDQMAVLDSYLAADLTTIPRGTQAVSYFLSLSGTVPRLDYTFTDGQIRYDLPLLLPWLDAAGDAAAAHAVSLNDFAVRRGGRYRVSEGARLAGQDDFGMVVTDTAEAQYVEARGAWLHAFYSVDGITRTLDGAPLTILPRGEDCEVAVRISAADTGNDVAISTTLAISYSGQITPTAYPANVTVISNTLLWDVGDLAPGTESDVVVTFFVPGEATANLWQPHDYVLALNWTDADFFNRFSGTWILDARVGGDFAVPVDGVFWGVMLPMVSLSPPEDFTSLQVGEAIPLRPVTGQGETFYTTTLEIPARLPEGGHFYFSASPESVTEIVVDDALFVLLGDTVSFEYAFSNLQHPPLPAIVEIPRSTVESWAGQTITIEYRDLYGVVVEASEIWLVWEP